MPSKASILTLPHEVLERTFSLLPFYDVVWHTKDNGAPRTLPQIQVLRSVSRKFRYVANLLPFWLAEDLNFRKFFSTVWKTGSFSHFKGFV
jgi:F-box domain